MLIRKRRGLRATLTACTVTAALLGGAGAQSASAWVPCPTGGNSAGAIDEWETIWPTGGADAKGVTMCLGEEGIFGSDKGWLQIVDLNDGASIRLMGDREPTGPASHPYQPDVVFRKRTAHDWYTWLQSLNPNEGENFWWTRPAARYLFSTTNASFFKDSDNDHDTTVPFPRRDWGGLAASFGVSSTLRDSDWDAPKRGLLIGDPDPWDSPVQKVRVVNFTTHYVPADIPSLLMHVGGNVNNYDTVDYTVSFTPDYRVGGASRRNYLGVYRNVVYLFTSDADYTNAQAIAIMQEINPNMDLIQLDGGGSAQMYSLLGEMDSSIPIFDREVADVLAIYRAP